uniref:hypothetical protein n=1 Tax=Trichocoleus desertorum TaxID=1481672 RepID=UPI0025B44179|nr:hypothetical protein [Trichocoleus desertorum]
MSDLLQSGEILYSPGGHFCYRIVGPCCRLFDREQLPWPCCRLEWRGKEPSWRRIGKRYVPDLATKTHPSYSVEILGQGCSGKTIEITLYPVKLSPAQQEWWYSANKSSQAQYPLETAGSSLVAQSTPLSSGS